MYTAWLSSPTAVTDYRLRLPLKELARQQRVGYVFDDGKEMSAVRKEVMERMDFLWYHLLVDEALFKQCLIEPEKRPAVIFGADDDIENVSPFNPAFPRLGTKSFRGEELQPGDSLMHPDGYMLWEDGKVYGQSGLFDIARNKFRLELLRGIAQEADGVVVTNEYLRQVYEGYGARNVLVYPNHLDFDQYPRIPVRYDDEVRILYQGAASHYEDWWPIRDAFVRVLKKYPNAKFVYFGHPFKWITRGMPPAQFEQIPWVSYDAFYPRLCTIGHDIALCPLSATRFALGKTPIKWYESSAIPDHPAACLAANYGPFREEMVDGETGLLYNNLDEFETKLCQLIEDATLRKQLASNAADWAHENRDVRKGVAPLYEFLKEIHSERREEGRSAKRRLVVPGGDEPSDEPVRDEPVDEAP